MSLIVLLIIGLLLNVTELNSRVLNPLFWAFQRPIMMVKFRNGR